MSDINEDKDDDKKSAVSQNPRELTENDVVITGYPRNDDEWHCFPYYDFMVSVALRFDVSFVFVLVVLNINFGLWVLITLGS